MIEELPVGEPSVMALAVALVIVSAVQIAIRYLPPRTATDAASTITALNGSIAALGQENTRLRAQIAVIDAEIIRQDQEIATLHGEVRRLQVTIQRTQSHGGETT